MPDVKPPPACDYPSSSASSSSLRLVIDMEPCIADLPPSPDPLSSFPRHRPDLPRHPVPFPLMSRCSSSTLLTNLGLRYCSARPGPLGPGPGPGPFGYTAGNRPYRSMENLNWNAVADSVFCAFNGAPYRSTDGEFILHYTSNSHWYDGPPDGSMVGAPGLTPHQESLALYPRHLLPRKDLPLFPQLLFSGGVDEWDARKGLREKLRLQSARSSVEPQKPLPLRPPAATGVASMPPGSTRITSPEEIKQEVLRRLQLRRQNSSPNLVLHGSPSSPTAAENTAGNRSRPPAGRLHIPTFEEFKRMRQKERDQDQESAAAETSDAKVPPSGGGNREQPEPPEEVQGEPRPTRSSQLTAYAPICTGPSPRSPLQTLASSTQEREEASSSRRRRSSLEPAGSVPFPPGRENQSRPSSCCPALLLEGPDLSRYGAKIYKMKDGLIGSALDLIKKR